MTTRMVVDENGGQVGPVLHDDVAVDNALDKAGAGGSILTLGEADFDELDARGVPFYRVVGGGAS